MSAVNRRELEAVADHPSARVPVTLYGVSDGLETIQMCGGEKPAGLLTRSGEVWFPSSKGFLTVPVSQRGAAKALPVVIDQLVADGLQVPAKDKISLGPDNAKVEFHFGVVLLRSQERIAFATCWTGSTSEGAVSEPRRLLHQSPSRSVSFPCRRV